MNNELIYRVLIQHCCGDSDMVLKIRDNSVRDGYLREADHFEEWLKKRGDILMYSSWVRSSHDGVEIFSRDQDTIYICRNGIDPSQYVEMEIIIYGD